MQIQTIQSNDSKIADVVSENILIANPQEGLDLLGNLYYQGFDKIILYKENIAPEFFDLKTGLAGEILQKFSNYRVRLIIVGDFSIFKSKSLEDFIFESNKSGHINFVSSREEALSKF